jgi:hypothetical protein
MLSRSLAQCLTQQDSHVLTVYSIAVYSIAIYLILSKNNIMTLLATQTETSVNHGNVSPNHSQKTALRARWVVEHGKLICKWQPID